jgi:glycosyltransferase involved in cell wall biosynthesis
MVNPEISVVVAARDAAGTLPGLLRALDNQILPRERFEVVIVDDGSRDQTAAVVDTWASEDRKSRSLVRGMGRGAGYARNLGIRKSHAPWVAFTDSDTMPEPDWLSSALDVAHRENMDGLEGVVETWPADAVGPFTHQLDSRNGGHFATANMVYRRSLLELLGGFDERFGGAFLEDVDLAFRALDAGARIVFRPEVRVRHQVLQPSPLKVLTSTRRQRWIPLIAQKHEGRYWSDVRRTVRPLTSVDVDVLLGLLALLAVPRASGLSRAVLLLSSTSGLRRGFGAARLTDVRGSELVVRAALSLALPVAKGFWWVEGSFHFKKLVW